MNPSITPPKRGWIALVIVIVFLLVTFVIVNRDNEPATDNSGYVPPAP